MKLLKYVCLSMTALLLFGCLACAKTASQDQTQAADAPAQEAPKSADPAPADEASAPTEAPAEAPSETEAPAKAPAETPEAPAAPERKKVLVVVFSATGTTRAVAEKIAAIEDADLYEIVPAEPYSDADLNWNDRNSRSTREQNDTTVRPAIAGEVPDLLGYERIYVGYPIWWGEEPRILDTFVESLDFGSITMIPFCTSASSGLGRSGRNLADNAGSGNWLEGKRFPGGVSESDVANWISGLK